MEWVFIFPYICGFCGIKFFTVAGVQILPPSSLKNVTQLHFGRQQTQLGTQYGWPLAHVELLRLLTGCVFNPAGCPYHTPSWPENLVGETV